LLPDHTCQTFIQLVQGTEQVWRATIKVRQQRQSG
jgi:hypothetical protein